MECSAEVRRSLALCKVQVLVRNIYGDPPTSEVEVASSSLKIVVKQGAVRVQTELVFPERMQASTPNRLMCFMCPAETLGDERPFTTVLLPSEDWEEKAGEWFCRPVAEARNIRVPGVREMFTSPTKLIVHDILLREAFFKGKQLCCEACRSVPGRSETDASVALFRTRVKVERLDDENDQTFCVRSGGRDAPDVLAAVLREHFGESQTCKVLVKAIFCFYL